MSAIAAANHLQCLRLYAAFRGISLRLHDARRCFWHEESLNRRIHLSTPVRIAMKPTIIAAAALTFALSAVPANADVIMDWNAKADAIGAEKQLVNSANTRAQAMLHVAMFE